MPWLIPNSGPLLVWLFRCGTCLHNNISVPSSLERVLLVMHLQPLSLLPRGPFLQTLGPNQVCSTVNLRDSQTLPCPGGTRVKVSGFSANTVQNDEMKCVVGGVINETQPEVDSEGSSVHCYIPISNVATQMYQGVPRVSQGGTFLSKPV